MPGLLKTLIHFLSLWLMAEHFACKIKCAATFLRSVLTERKQMQAVSSFSAIQTHQRISRHLQECRRRNKVSDTILEGVQWDHKQVVLAMESHMSQMSHLFSSLSLGSSSITKNRSDHSFRQRLCFSNMPASLCRSAIAELFAKQARSRMPCLC